MNIRLQRCGFFRSEELFNWFFTVHQINICKGCIMLPSFLSDTHKPSMHLHVDSRRECTSSPSCLFPANRQAVSSVASTIVFPGSYPLARSGKSLFRENLVKCSNFSAFLFSSWLFQVFGLKTLMDVEN